MRSRRHKFSIVVPATSLSAKKTTHDPHSEFLNLPQNSKYCSSADVEFGKFVHYAELFVNGRIKSVYTLGHWEEHKVSRTHQQAVAQEDKSKWRNRLEGNEALTKIKQTFLAQKSKTKQQ